MPLKIKISRPSIPAEPRPTKRRIQRIDSDDEDSETAASAQDALGPRPKKARTISGGASNHSEEDNYAGDAADEDIDIDGDVEDTRFLPDASPPASHPLSPGPSATRRLSNATASSSKSRAKDKGSKSSKSSKSSGKKRRAVVWTDDEDEEFDDPDVVITDDEDFNLDTEYSSKKSGVKGKNGKIAAKTSGKGTATKKEDKEITFRDERKIVQPPAADPVKRVKEDEGIRSTPDPMDEPIPKKRKLPPIKKNKPAGSILTGPSTSAPVKPPAATPAKKEETIPTTTLTPAPTSNQVGVRKPAGASTDLNLLDSSVYSELFMRAPGGSTPNSGLNRKQKEEERRKELNKMREEARAKREAEAKHAFDLQAGPEKIQRYEEVLRAHHSIARYPNLLGAAFKEIADRNRERLAAQQ
ncbi:hypothetical protein DICSQDRAFT_165762 [Dichomitus squalens LYAD-421 SS1]|uniref:Uncharacterized protein n=1 Tax=Dichomitus squalens TaxID=114155 RepID=A0A4Q9N518_9APHY|nr:uncharacterized protein DICSQDRAFT_165762 [Dichomitus squalens LYAD-421 SS1]EJF66065.1 hypothetical protein DICSQDRAFT_165762 [Dichomitus squalens LYAD-421 SS1]TBU35740.1 hypothetical protein BD311DRAFT_708034 [Dichomitus squalens]